MYIWTGMVLPKKFEENIRNICRNINKDFNVSEQSFTLPQHISLKTSFNVLNYQEVLNKKLYDEFNIPKIKFDGVNFKFHSTIFQDIENDDKLAKIYEKLKKEFQFPIELEINEINFGISDVGQVGTYSVYDKMYYLSRNVNLV